MTLLDRASAEADEANGFTLVVFAYRCVMSELTGDRSEYPVGSWEIFEAASPPGEAEALFAGFHAFARALLCVADRPLAWRRTCCASLCRDEWLAVSMIDAAQRADVAGLLAVAAELVGVEGLGDVLSAAQSLARVLTRRGLALRPRLQMARLGPEFSAGRTLH